MENHQQLRFSTQRKPRRVYTVPLTDREVVAIVVALEEIHPRILGGLYPDAFRLLKKLRVLG